MNRRDKTNYYLDMAQVALERGDRAAHVGRVRIELERGPAHAAAVCDAKENPPGAKGAEGVCHGGWDAPEGLPAKKGKEEKSVPAILTRGTGPKRPFFLYAAPDAAPPLFRLSGA